MFYGFSKQTKKPIEPIHNKDITTHIFFQFDQTIKLLAGSPTKGKRIGIIFARTKAQIFFS